MPRRFAALLVATATLLVLPRFLSAETLPAGTRLEVRLSVATGSRISRHGDHIEAVVIAPVFVEGRLLIPQGATVSGVVESVERLGLGLKHLTAALEYAFDTVQLPDGAAIPIEARVTEVETAKERVNAQGIIGGIYPTANVSSSVAFYAIPLLFVDPEFAVPALGVKCLIARSPDPEIYFPAGTEVILQLTAEANIPHSSAAQTRVAPLSPADVADANELLAQLPEQRTDRGPNHSSDLINILFLGSRDSINRAFRAAGWSGAQRGSLRSVYRMYHCMVQRMGYSMAPMGNLKLNGVTADADYQKSLDTFSKRHHLRLWKQGKEDAWLSAATEDIGYAVRRMHLTHATDPLIDNERAKVLNDLAFTGCVDSASLIARESADAPDQQQRSIGTDGKVAVIRMNECSDPRTAPSQASGSSPRGRIRAVQALVALRNDLIRTNPISLAYNTTRVLRQRRASHVDGSLSASSLDRQQRNSLQSSIQPRWIRPSAFNATSATHP